jgi:replicative DNA helicase
MSGLPADIDAEAAVLGAALLSPKVVMPGLSRWLDAGDFFAPNHQIAWAGILEVWESTGHVDAVTLHAAVPDVPIDLLFDVQAGVPAISAAGRYARIVARHAKARKMIALCAGISNDALVGVDVDDLVGRLAAGTAELASLGIDLDAPDDLATLDDWLDEAAASGAAKLDYLIPGCLTTQDKAIITAAEGVGKMVLLRQFVQLAAAGQHPLVPGYRIRPLITLLVDVENPKHAIHLTAGPVRAALRHEGDDTSSAWIWHRPEGVDLRSRRGRSELESVLTHVGPELVCMGPLYKLFDRMPGETDEQAAKAVQAVLDDMRTRHRFGLIMEHHAPHGSGHRDLRPFGSSAWQRWPEYGIGLRPSPRDGYRGAADVERWRPDRIPAIWPKFLWMGKAPRLWDSWFDMDPRVMWDEEPTF